MNQKALENIVKFYKLNYNKIEAQEIYKWKAFKTFHDKWNIDATDFKGMLAEALKDVSNLMSAANYYPKRMILWMAGKDEAAVKAMFQDLYDPSVDLRLRMDAFKEAARELVEKYKEKNVHHTYQDDRAIMVYLSLRYPETYYLYKYTMFKDFVEYVDYDTPPKSGNDDNIPKFLSLCDYIRNYIQYDTELLEMYAPRKVQYYDPDYHLLVQDIIYTTYYQEQPELLESVQIVKPTEFQKNAVVNPIVLEGKTGIDYIEEEKRRKEIGDLGEQFVYDQERAKVKQYKLPKSKQVVWVSRDKGDGFGYDILSYDEAGNEMYIEVKTTVGAENTSFFISANELAKSKQCADHYYLYRVYEFDKKTVTGKYSVLKGSLEDLCLVPISYRVDLQ